MEGAIGNKTPQKGKGDKGKKKRRAQRQRHVTAGSGGAGEAHCMSDNHETFMESGDSLLDTPGQSAECMYNEEQLTGQTGNSGAEVARMSYNKGMSGNGSHGTCPTDDVRDVSYNITSETIGEIARDERPADYKENETSMKERHPDNKARDTSFEGKETATYGKDTGVSDLQNLKETVSQEREKTSDDSDEWETASEEGTAHKDQSETFGEKRDSVSDTKETDSEGTDTDKNDDVDRAIEIISDLNKTPTEELQNGIIFVVSECENETKSETEETICEETKDDYKETDTVSAEAPFELKEAEPECEQTVSAETASERKGVEPEYRETVSAEKVCEIKQTRSEEMVAEGKEIEPRHMEDISKETATDNKEIASKETVSIETKQKSTDEERISGKKTNQYSSSVVLLQTLNEEGNHGKLVIGVRERSDELERDFVDTATEQEEITSLVYETGDNRTETAPEICRPEKSLSTKELETAYEYIEIVSGGIKTSCMSEDGDSGKVTFIHEKDTTYNRKERESGEAVNQDIETASEVNEMDGEGAETRTLKSDCDLSSSDQRDGDTRDKEEGSFREISGLTYEEKEVNTGYISEKGRETDSEDFEKIGISETQSKHCETFSEMKEIKTIERESIAETWNIRKLSSNISEETAYIRIEWQNENTVNERKLERVKEETKEISEKKETLTELTHPKIETASETKREDISIDDEMQDRVMKDSEMETCGVIYDGIKETVSQTWTEPEMNETDGKARDYKNEGVNEDIKTTKEILHVQSEEMREEHVLSFTSASDGDSGYPQCSDLPIDSKCFPEMDTDHQCLYETPFQYTDLIYEKESNLNISPNDLKEPVGTPGHVMTGETEEVAVVHSGSYVLPVDEEDPLLEIPVCLEEKRYSIGGSKTQLSQNQDCDKNIDGLHEGVTFLTEPHMFLQESAEMPLQEETPVDLQDSVENILQETEKVFSYTMDNSLQEANLIPQDTGNVSQEQLMQSWALGETVTSLELADEIDVRNELWGAMQLTRQRSYTDPSHEGRMRSSTLQPDLHIQGSIHGNRIRSLTPPCGSRQQFLVPLSDITQPSLIESMALGSVDPSSIPEQGSKIVELMARGGESEASVPAMDIYPTQIFNPIFLLSESPEEFGFYQEEEFAVNLGDDKTEVNFSLPSEDIQIHQTVSQSSSEQIQFPQPSVLHAHAAEIRKEISPQTFSPLWLPPSRPRYTSDLTGTSKEKGSQVSRLSEPTLVRRPTIRHKKGGRDGPSHIRKRFSSFIPSLAQQESSTESVTSDPQNNLAERKSLLRQHKISEDKEQKLSVSDQPNNKSSMDKLIEGEEQPAEKEAAPKQSIILREKRVTEHKPVQEMSSSLHRRHSKLFNSSSLLYQEYSDVALNQEIQKHKVQDCLSEERDPGSPRLRRRALSSQDSYLQRLSISSADSLWQDIPVIRGSSTFLSMSREKQKLQEAKFELIMSEALYLRSLNIAVDHFLHSTELNDVLSAQDRQWLFSRLSEVRDASSDFLFDLEEEFEADIYSFQVCSLVIIHEPNFRRVYLPYVTNQSYQERTFQRLLADNPKFRQVLGRLESDPVCQRLSLKSFLILPFQRITRLRLLLQNILKRSAPGSSEESEATEAHNALEKLIKDCNESVQRMKDTEELILLNQKIQFECKIFPLISQSRRLVKHGEITSLEFSNSLTFRWKVTTRPVYLHLFNDCLLLSRLKEGGRFVVFDYANSSDVRVERCEMKIHGPQKNTFRIFLKESAMGARDSSGRDIGQDGRETEYIFRTETQSQKLRWILALSPPKVETDLLKYHDLPQVQCLKAYKSRENDELSLDKADIIMMTQKSEDGWFYGVRLSDLQSGWFPQSHVQAISRHAGLRNLEEERRLQTLRAKLQPAGAK